MSTQYPPLPHRRLKLMANGIWDEIRKEFYPFKLSHVTVPAKRGIIRYVHTAQTSAHSSGDTPAGHVSWAISVGSTTVYVARASVCATVAASNVNACNSSYQLVSCLADEGSALTFNSASVSSGIGSIVYAEIPADRDWVYVE